MAVAPAEVWAEVASYLSANDAYRLGEALGDPEFGSGRFWKRRLHRDLSSFYPRAIRVAPIRGRKAIENIFRQHAVSSKEYFRARLFALGCLEAMPSKAVSLFDRSPVSFQKFVLTETSLLPEKEAFNAQNANDGLPDVPQSWIRPSLAPLNVVSRYDRVRYLPLLERPVQDFVELLASADGETWLEKKLRRRLMPAIDRMLGLNPCFLFLLVRRGYRSATLSGIDFTSLDFSKGVFDRRFDDTFMATAAARVSYLRSRFDDRQRHQLSLLLQIRMDL